jgi:DNA-binding MarR family transcriptional regulator
MKRGEMRTLVLAAWKDDPRASLRELCRKTGIRSTSTVSYHLDRLEEDGLIKRVPGQARGIYEGDGSTRTRKTRNEGFVESLKRTYESLKAFIHKNKYAPTRLEWAALSGNSVANLERHLQILIHEGYVERVSDGLQMARNMRLTGKDISELQVKADEVVQVKKVRGKLVLRRQQLDVYENKALPRLTAAEQEARINMVVEKARLNDERRMMNDERVIHVGDFQRFTACKVG